METKKSILISIVSILILVGVGFIGYTMFSLNRTLIDLEKKVPGISLENLEQDMDTVISNTEGIIEKLTDAEKRTFYEYKLLYTFREDDTFASLEKSVNELGSYGWEYVGYIMNNGTNARLVLFKRLKK